MAAPKLGSEMRSVRRQRVLADVECIEITCSDCGRGRLWMRADIDQRGLPGTATLDDLGKKLVCKTCRAQGGLGYNVEIRDLTARLQHRRAG